VRYWELEPSSGSFEPNDEVDEIEWLAPDVAAERLTYSRDWTVLRSLESRR
jgi:8-oxo-dGTP diphosphatase